MHDNIPTDNIHTLVGQLYADTYNGVLHFLPESILCAVMVLLLVVRIVKWTDRWDVFWLALIGAVAALVSTNFWILFREKIPRQELFTGMLVYDGFTVLLRGILIGFVVLFLLFSRLTRVPDKEERPDIYVLALGATLGMCLMASANHMLTVFLAVEMASVPSYVLAGMLKGQRKSSEAAIKYAVYGAGAAGVMLYGISLIAGITNTLHLPTIGIELANEFPSMQGDTLMVLALGGLMIGVGLAFKLSAVPFHFWCPDVFEGATAEVASFLSIASKAAALALLIRVAVGIGVAPSDPSVALSKPSEATAMQAPAGLYAVAEEAAPTGNAPAEAPVVDEATAPVESTSAAGEANGGTPANKLESLRSFIGQLIAFLAIVTCTFGNLAAYGQTNAKRLLAYSTIAHAGYMMMAVPPILAMAGIHPLGAHDAISGLAIYIIVYVFMNLTAFAFVAFLHDKIHSDEIADYAGLIQHCPLAVILLSLTLFSLVGLPPLAGFIGKFAIFASLAEGWSVAGQTHLMVLLVAGGLNTAISLFYYLRVVKTMTMEPAPESRTTCSLDVGHLGFLVLLSIPTAALIVYWQPLKRLADHAAATLL